MPLEAKSCKFSYRNDRIAQLVRRWTHRPKGTGFDPRLDHKRRSTYAILVLVLVIALRPQTPKHIRGGWSHYTDTSESVDDNGAQNMVHVQSGFRTRDISISGPTRLPTALTGHTKNITEDCVSM
jgi:hypothetical protein